MKLLLKTYHAGNVLHKTTTDEFNPDYLLDIYGPEFGLPDYPKKSDAEKRGDDYITPLYDIAYALATIGQYHKNDRDADRIYTTDKFGNGTVTKRIRTFRLTIGTPSTIGIISAEYPYDNPPTESIKYNIHEYAPDLLIGYLKQYYLPTYAN